MRKFASLLALSALLSGHVAAAQSDPNNPTCPSAPNWSTNREMRFTPQVVNGRRVLLAEGQIDDNLVSRLETALRDETIEEIWLRSPGGNAEVGNRAGIPLEGVGFPGHFLVRIVGTAEPVLLDPFFAGRQIGYDELKERLRAFYSASGAPSGSNMQRALPQALQTTGPLGILSRMLGNLLAIYREREAHESALATVELLLVLWPDAPDHVRIRGLLYEQLECFASAVADFRRYLALAPEASGAAQVPEHLEQLEDVTTTTLH
jgi:tetratricopeptide (TPR) repeat protein